MEIVVLQDGNKFYFAIDGMPQIETAPMPVMDGDIQAAKRARRWFVEFICYESGFVPTWVQS